MNLGNFTRPKKVIGIDLGNHSVKTIQVSKYGKKVYIEEVGYADIDFEMFNTDPVKAQCTAIELALEEMDRNKSLIVCGLPGNTAVVRYPKITLREGERLEDVILREASQYIPFDLNEVYLSWDIIEENPSAEVKQVQTILVAAKKDVINSRLNVLEEAKIQCSVFDIDSIAVFNAIQASNLMRPNETLAIFEVGFISSSVHFVRDCKSIFIRDLGWGAKDILDAISREKQCDFRYAEKIFVESAADILPHPEAPVVEAIEEQPENEDIVIPEEAVPVEEFQEEGEESAYSYHLSTHTGREKSIREILLSPMNRMITEIKRSFDFYEHQLYEKPVERVILCGGASCYPLIGETLVHELNVDTVEVVDLVNDNFVFSNSQTIKLFKNHSAKFSVALGLAIRGLEEI